MTDELIREIVFLPAFDKRDPDPDKNYGIRGANIIFYLKGPKGVIQFVVDTNWQLPHVQEELDAQRPSSQFPYLFHKPLPTDIGYHSKFPQYDGQEQLTSSCEFTDGEPCYYDGSSLNADVGFKLLVSKGHEAVWEWMRKYYDELIVPVGAARGAPAS